MAQRHHQIRTRLARGGGPGGGGLHHVARLGHTVEVRPIPDRDLRRRKPDHADTDRQGLSVLSDQRALQHHEGRAQQAVIAGRLAAPAHDIRRHDGKLGIRQRAVEESEAEVEFVVAQRDGVIFQRVHRSDHRVDVARRKTPVPGDVVAQRAALKKVAIVEQQAVRRLGPQPRDQPAGARQAKRVAGLVGVIVVGQHVDMQISGREQPQVHRAGSRLRCFGLAAVQAHLRQDHLWWGGKNPPTPSLIAAVIAFCQRV
jgi:hypothetical protein